jgi:hypothetical protein
VGAAGAVRSGGDTVYGANFEVRFKSKDFPIEQDQSRLGLSLMKWRGDLGLMANLQSQLSIRRNSKMAAGMNNKRSGQVTIKASSSEMQVALIAICSKCNIPLEEHLSWLCCKQLTPIRSLDAIADILLFVRTSILRG